MRKLQQGRYVTVVSFNVVTINITQDSSAHHRTVDNDYVFAAAEEDMIPASYVEMMVTKCTIHHRISAHLNVSEHTACH